MDVFECVIDSFGFADLLCCGAARQDENIREEEGAKGRVCRFPRMLTIYRIFMAMLDGADVVLDYMLAHDLGTNLGERDDASIVRAATTASLLVTILMKSIMYKLKKAGFEGLDGNNIKTIYVINVIVLEYFVFMIEDGSTILVFTRVPGSFNPDSIFSHLNLWISILSGGCVTVGVIVFGIGILSHSANAYNEIVVWHCLFYVAYLIIIALSAFYTMYVAIATVLFDNDMENAERVAFRVAILGGGSMAAFMVFLSTMIGCCGGY